MSEMDENRETAEGREDEEKESWVAGSLRTPVGIVVGVSVSWWL